MPIAYNGQLDIAITEYSNVEALVSSHNYSVRSVVFPNTNVKIKSGNGTESSPYILTK